MNKAARLTALAILALGGPLAIAQAQPDAAPEAQLPRGMSTPGEVLRVIVQPRYDREVAPGVDRLELLGQALARRDRETAAELAAAPRDLRRVIARANYLSGRGRNEEALALLLPYARDFDRTLAAGPAGRELLQDASYALYAVGRDDEAILVMGSLAALPIAANPELINSRIDFLQILHDTGHHLQAVEGARGLLQAGRRYANAFGMAWVSSQMVCSLAALNRMDEARPHLARMRTYRTANPVAVTQASLCAGDDDAAAAELIRRLGSDDPAPAILALQNFDVRNGRHDPLYERLMALRERPDVRAALDRVGRVLTLPLPRSYWGYY